MIRGKHAPRSGCGLVSHCMDDHPSGRFAVPALGLEAVDDFSPQKLRAAEPQTSPTLAPQSRATRRRGALWLLLLVLQALRWG